MNTTVFSDDMLIKVQHQRACSVASVLEQVGEGWSFLVLRAAYFGESRFEGFVQTLSAPRAQIAQSLAKLTAAGILEGGGHQGYRLSPAGHRMFPICIGLMIWGDEYVRPILHPEQPHPPLTLHWRDDESQIPIKPIWICAHCQTTFTARDCAWIDGPGAGIQLRREGRYRPPNKTLYAKAQPCSVASALEIIGDRWTFLILREAFFGQRRFEDFVSRLGIARNVLANRLESLIATHLLERKQISKNSARMEYRLASAGLALYPLTTTMMNWGDRWLRAPNQEPLIVLHRNCGSRLDSVLVDERNGRVIESRLVKPMTPLAAQSVGR